MSSYQWETGQTLKSIATRIPADLSGLDVEQLQSLLSSIQGDAEEMYATYAYNMGWANSEEEARASLRESEESDTEDEESRPSSPIYLFEIPDWLAKKKELPATFKSTVIEESDKAYFTFFGWIPKSQCTRTETNDTVIVAGNTEEENH